MPKSAIVLSAWLIAVMGALGSGESAAKTPRAVPLQTYDARVERLPENFSGVDSDLFFQTFKKNLVSLRKKRSETEARFRSRVSNVDLILRPISTKVDYAFEIQGLSGRYDPIKGIHVFGGKQGYGCLASSVPEHHITCPLKERVLPQDGARSVPPPLLRSDETVHVQVRRETFGLAISQKSRFVEENFSLDRNKFYFRSSLHLPHQVEERLKGQRISVIFVGNLLGENLVDEHGSTALPVQTTRRNGVTLAYDIPFRVKRVVYYVYQTGEILQQADF